MDFLSFQRELINENVQLRDLNKRLMIQLELHVKANEELLKALKECRGDPEDKDGGNGKDKSKDSRMQIQRKDLV
jgi:hypothetical protein